MILSESDIKEIVLKNPHKDLVLAGQRYNKLLRMHMYGENLSGYLNTIEGYETEALRKLRVNYAKSNKDFFARLSRPVDKVFSAKGGSVYYNLAENEDEKARELSRDVKSGYSSKGWIENFWKPHFLDDPNGFIFMEMMPVQFAVKAKAEGRSFVYPTYKSIQSVYDYLPNGSKLEYVFFLTEKAERLALGLKEEDIVYRLVDDEKDVFVKKQGEDIILIDPMTNWFGQVPAMLNSDIPNPQMPGNMLSLFDEVIELANNFMLDGSIQLTHKLLHGFPKYWEYADDCKKCGGEKSWEGNTCEECKGTGKNIMSKVSDAKILIHPENKDVPIITPHVAGYVEPSEIYYRISTESLRLMEDIATFTIWGAAESKPQQPGMSTDGQKTATQVISEIKPQADRLTPISNMAEKREKFIMDITIRMNITYSYPGASINYGKRFMLEGPDVLWEKYQDAKTKGIAYSVLDDLLTEYYESKYTSDPVKLHIQSKLIKVEPFVHMTVQQVQSLNVSDQEYKNKLYYGEWHSTLDSGYLIAADAKKMKEDLTAFAASKELKPEQPKLLNAA